MPQRGDSDPCVDGLFFTSSSGLFCSLSKAKGRKSVGDWLDLDFPRSERSRGPSNTSLGPPAETLSTLTGEASFLSWGLLWLSMCSDRLFSLNNTVGSVALDLGALCLCQDCPNPCLFGLSCWPAGVRLAKRGRCGLAVCNTWLAAGEDPHGRATGLLLIGWGRQGTGAWSTCLLWFTSPPDDKELLRTAWGEVEDCWSSPSTLWTLDMRDVGQSDRKWPQGETLVRSNYLSVKCAANVDYFAWKLYKGMLKKTQNIQTN